MRCMLRVACCGSGCDCCFYCDCAFFVVVVVVMFVAVLLFVAAVVVGFLLLFAGCADVLWCCDADALRCCAGCL